MKRILFLFFPAFLFAQPPGVKPRPSPWSVGAVAIANTQPYKGADGQVRVFPVVMYRSETVQWYGPRLNVRLRAGEAWSLSGTVDVDFAAYDESDSEVFTGLGDREDTVLAGVEFSRDLGSSFALNLAVQTDVLQRHQGSTASVRVHHRVGNPWDKLSGGVSLGLVVFDEQWMEDRAGTPEYRPGVSLTPQVGGRVLYNLNPKWSAMLSLNCDLLDESWTDSPLVGDEVEISSILGLSRSW